MKGRVCSLVWIGIALCGGPVVADVSECSFPGVTIDDINPPTIDVIAVGASESIEDVRVSVNITHGWIDDVLIDISSPAGTTVRLHELGGADADDIIVTYSDVGVANGAVAYNLGCFMQPSGPGTMDDFAGENTAGDWTLTVTDTFPMGEIGTFNDWCLSTFTGTAPDPPLPIENLTCTSTGGTGVANLTWTNPVTYDFIDVFIGGGLIETLPGTATSYRTPPLPFPDTIEITLLALVPTGIPSCMDTSCAVTLQLLAADLEICNDPGVIIPFPGPPVTDTVTVMDDQVIGDVQVFVDITHSFIGDLTIDVEHDGTTVRLHDEDGGALDDLSVTYWDLGIPNNGPYVCGCLMQPTGPGMLMDFVGGSTLGDWSLIVEDVFTGSHPMGTFNSWCLLTYQSASVANLTCASASGSGIVDLNWTNTDSYDSINVYVNSVLDATLPGDATSHSTQVQPIPSTAVVCVEPVQGVTVLPQNCCSVEVIVDPVTAVDCSSDSGTGVAELTWDLPAIAFDSIEIQIDGVFEALLSGTDTSFTTGPQPVPSTITLGIIGFLNGSSSEVVTCTAPILGLVDVESCSSPGTFISNAAAISDTIDITQSTVIGDAEVFLDITHTWIGDLVIDCTSPGGTSVRLHEEDLGGDADDLLVIYSDSGIPNSMPYDCGCAMQPIGPGVMGDYVGELSNGDWSLDIADTFPTADGTLDRWCVRITSGCQVLPASDLTCTSLGPNNELGWINNAVYDGIDIIRDGALAATVPGDTTSFVDMGVPTGVHEYVVSGFQTAVGCGNPSSPCTTANGITDIIFRGETDEGSVDSVGALETALAANGRVVLVVDELTLTAVTVGGPPEILWVCLGTFPGNHRLSSQEGFVLAQLASGDLGLDGTQDQPPTPIYLESADTWGFDDRTVFEDYDGIENASFGNLEDGDDSLTSVIGADSGVGLDLTGFDDSYTQDNASGNDFTGRIVSADVNPDLGGAASGIVWTGEDALGMPYNVGNYYASSFAPVIGQTWEIGGYGGSIESLVAAYLEALLVAPPRFLRGDANADGDYSGLVDGIFILNFQFVPGSPAPPCMDAADLDDDGLFTGLVDGVFALTFQFVIGSPEPPPPGPMTCGPDPTDDALECDSHPCP